MRLCTDDVSLLCELCWCKWHWLAWQRSTRFPASSKPAKAVSITSMPRRFGKEQSKELGEEFSLQLLKPFSVHWVALEGIRG